MILDKRITEFVNSHPGNWQISMGVAQLSLPSSVLFVSIHNGQLTVGVSFIGGSSMNVHRDQLLERLARWEVRWMIECKRSMNGIPPWLVEPVRVELRRRANELLTLSGAPTVSPESSPESQALEDAREVLRGATGPAVLPADLIEIGIITDRKGIRVTIDKGGYRLFTSRYVQPDQLIGAFEDASQFIIDWMPYDDGGAALKSVCDWIKRLSVVSDLRRILGVTV